MSGDWCRAPLYRVPDNTRTGIGSIMQASFDGRLTI